MPTVSLQKRFFALNCAVAFACVGAVSFIYISCGNSFTRIVDSSAKNLSLLSKTGELKSLLAQEQLLRGERLKKKMDSSNEQEFTQKMCALESSMQLDLPMNIQGEFKEFRQEFDRCLSLIEANLNDPHQRGPDYPLFRKAYGSLNQFSDFLLINGAEQQASLVRQGRRIMALTLFLVITTMLGFLVFFYKYLHVSIVRPVVGLAEASRQAAQGNFKALTDIHSNDEIGLLSQNFNHMLREISSSIETKERLRSEAEKANLAKSVFLANMSHELRTPMHGILSFARFGQQKTETATKEKLRSYFDEIHDSGSRLMSLLNDLLDLSKLESGKTIYSMRSQDLHEIAVRVLKEMKAFAAEKLLTIQITSKAPELLGIFDGEKIMQVIRNLVSNAIKFSSRNTVIEIDLIGTHETLQCCVRNLGVGIPASELETIFDKFVQSSKTTTAAGGTGLGLAICKEIVTQHGGKIWASQQKDGATEFTFFLPRRIETSKSEAA